MVGVNLDQKITNRLVVLWLIICLGIGGFLRLYQLGVPSVWVDELNHHYAAKSLVEYGSPKLPSGELYERAIVYSKFVSYSYQFFGMNEFSLRFPSAVIGVMCIVVIYFVTRRFFGITVALLSALFVAVSPFEIGWSRISRMYTLFQFLFLFAIYTFYLGFENQKKDRFSRWQTKIFEWIHARKVLSFIEKWNLNLFWLFVSIILFLLSYMVHQLTVLFVVGVWLYLALMFIIQWYHNNFLQAIKTKYGIFLLLSFVVTFITITLIPSITSFTQYALTYSPKWADMPKFQNSKLYLDFVFNHYNFPVGVLFVIGIYQVMSRLHQYGIYIISVFAASLFMFTFVFSYRHLQYLYNIYAILIIISAYALSNIIHSELIEIRKNWLKKSRINRKTIKAVVVCCFLIWIPLTPSLRLAKSIPFNQDGSFNGAIYLPELRQACNYVRKNYNENDLIVSANALGAKYYLGQVDYDLNFADFDLAQEKKLINKQGKYFDLYTGKPFIQSEKHLENLMSQYHAIWILSEEYKFLRAPVYVPVSIRDFILANFDKVFSTKHGTVLVYHYTKL